MKIICVIPARGGSNRFFEKPLALICGKPMIWWVYSHCKEVACFDEVYVATDSLKIESECINFGAKVIMTSPTHDTATERLYEVSTKIQGDLYVMVNGDEPALTSKDIIKCIPENIDTDAFYVSNLMTDFENPVEVVDVTNLKIVTNNKGLALFISRSPIPYPKGDMDYVYHKFVGVGAFTNKALDFYHKTARGPIERIEENDSFRFIENQMPIYYINAHCKSISVDTPKDISIVERYLSPPCNI
ncbi:3-deoxy-manno-octulosonate cytidylyltransferase [Spirochaetia bacterium]|nr:3-deoxy-manno-octulosonate cytidylyltransferase [Spirochaetia bacterium]